MNGLVAQQRSQAPVVLVLPARNEAANVAGVVARVPRLVGGHPVLALVIDDGSTDATAEAAWDAGADVVAMEAPSGLGAAVRRGLAEAVARGAVVVAFCDADGEYAPEELDRLAGPILAGRADYVVGSRFAGGPRRMRRHRWLGNRLLTIALSAVVRRRLTDGQSGYRALSAEAAAAARIVHDYNYAQVLTLDLIGRGFRYAEVPISYRFRTNGRSFVRLVPYLCRVVPAVVRQLRRDGLEPFDQPALVGGGTPIGLGYGNRPCSTTAAVIGASSATTSSRPEPLRAPSAPHGSAARRSVVSSIA
jgi:glycosyltransferase involved in cell wall biosynthesis